MVLIMIYVFVIIFLPEYGFSYSGTTSMFMAVGFFFVTIVHYKIDEV